MIIIKTLEETCSGCPTQFHGKTNDDKKVYIRFRWGRLRMEIDNAMIFNEVIADSLSGCISIDEIKSRLMFLNIKWPDEIPINRDYINYEN